MEVRLSMAAMKHTQTTGLAIRLSVTQEDRIHGGSWELPSWSCQWGLISFSVLMVDEASGVNVHGDIRAGRRPGQRSS